MNKQRKGNQMNGQRFKRPNIWIIVCFINTISVLLLSILAYCDASPGNTKWWESRLWPPSERQNFASQSVTILYGYTTPALVTHVLMNKHIILTNDQVTMSLCDQLMLERSLIHVFNSTCQGTSQYEDDRLSYRVYLLISVTKIYICQVQIKLHVCQDIIFLIIINPFCFYSFKGQCIG